MPARRSGSLGWSLSFYRPSCDACTFRGPDHPELSLRAQVRLSPPLTWTEASSSLWAETYLLQASLQPPGAQGAKSQRPPCCPDTFALTPSTDPEATATVFIPPFLFASLSRRKPRLRHHPLPRHLHKRGMSPSSPSSAVEGAGLFPGVDYGWLLLIMLGTPLHRHPRVRGTLGQRTLGGR